jgi:uroporphyrinogen III methyltransferase / synthase
VNGQAGDARPLAGRRVLVTRPRAQAGALVDLLEAAGATAILAPAIRIAAPADPAPLHQAASNVAQYDWIVFASVNAVDALLAATAPAGGAALPAVAAVGRKTADHLHARGVKVAVVPDEFTAEALVKALTSHASLHGTRVLLPKSEIGRTSIAEGLRTAGAIVTEVIAYRPVAEAQGRDTPDVRRLLEDRQLDAVTFTSGSAAINFVQIHGAGTVDLLRRTVVAAIGPVTADAVRELGIEVQVQPAIYTAAAMVEALADYFSHPVASP